MDTRETLLTIINTILAKKGREQLVKLDENISLRKHLDFDSLDLAELTVKLEDATGIDIFADGIVDTIGQIIAKLDEGKGNG